MLFETGSMYAYPPMFTMPPRSSLWRRSTQRTPYLYPPDDDFEIIVPDEFWDPVVPERHDSSKLTTPSCKSADGCDVMHAINSDFKSRERTIPIKIEHFRSNNQHEYVTLDSSDEDRDFLPTKDMNYGSNNGSRLYDHAMSRSSIRNERPKSEYKPRELLEHSRNRSKSDKQYSYVMDRNGRFRKYEMLSDDETDIDTAKSHIFQNENPTLDTDLSHNFTTSTYSSKKSETKLTADKFKCPNYLFENDQISKNKKHYQDDEFVDLTTDAESLMKKSDSNKNHENIGYSSNIISPPSYPAYNIIRREISKFDGQVDYIRGDGNCFFRALSKVIYGSESFHEEMREAVVDFLAKHHKKFAQFVDDSTVEDHITSMRKEGAWATQAEIYATATMLQRDVFILSPDHTGDKYHWLLFSPQFKISDGEFHPCHITLCHTNGNHYDRIAPPSGKECNCGVPTPRLSGVESSVDLTDTTIV